MPLPEKVYLLDVNYRSQEASVNNYLDDCRRSGIKIVNRLL